MISKVTWKLRPIINNLDYTITMEQSRHRLIHWKYLAILIGVFTVGTLVDVAMQQVTGFALGGIGANLAMITAIMLMYRYTGERFSFKSLVRMLRFVKPHFPTVWDKLATLILAIGIVVAPFVLFDESLGGFDSSILLYAISAAIIPPALEELANRGFIQTSLERMGYSFWWVVGMSTFVFSISHYPVNPDSVVVSAIPGLIFGILTVRTRSVIIPFLLHGLWNFIAVAFG